MDKMTLGTTSTGWFATLYGMYSVTEWCGIIGVVLTGIGIFWGIFNQQRQYKLQKAESESRVRALEETITTLLKERK